MPTMQGQLPQLILKFAPDRQFRVRVGSCLSDAYSQEMGVSKEVSSHLPFYPKINSRPIA